MTYAIYFKPSVVKSLKKLSKSIQKQVRSKINALAHDLRPPDVKKLTGDPNLWRIRVGSYRIVYEIHDKRLVILIMRIAHRKDVYR